MYLENISKIYDEKGSNPVIALKDITISFKPSTMYAIMGESGSGKTTLLNIIGLLDRATQGKYLLDNKDINDYNETELAKIRNNKIGFVFQNYFLDNKLTALENILLPTIINNKYSKDEYLKKAQNLLKEFGLSERANHNPKQLSGGECQRVAIIRALINDPEIIIADEPTGNLDSKHEQEIFKLLKDISRTGKCVIVVSHNSNIKKYCDEIFYLEEGTLTTYENNH